MKTITQTYRNFTSFTLLIFAFFNNLKSTLACEVDDFCRTLYNIKNAKCISGVCVCHRGFHESALFDADCETGQAIDNNNNFWYTMKILFAIFVVLVFVTICSYIIWLFYYRNENSQPGSAQDVEQPKENDQSVSYSEGVVNIN